MLVNQGVIGFRLWTGIDPDSTVMRKRLKRYLLDAALREPALEVGPQVYTRVPIASDYERGAVIG